MKYSELFNASFPVLGPIFDLVSKILGAIMNTLFEVYASIAGGDILNIGVAIIIFTVIINVLLIPSSIKQQRSTRLMSIIQPELKAIQEKYKHKKNDTEASIQMNAEIRAVYEKYGTSMTAGCLPVLLQMPILIALNQVIQNIPKYVNIIKAILTKIADQVMSQSDYISKITDFAQKYNMPTSKVDYTLKDKLITLLYKFTPSTWAELEGKFPEVKSAIAQSMEKIQKINHFAGISLSTPPWQGMVPTVAWLIPILAAITQWYVAKLMSVGTENFESEAASQAKSMNTIMPIMSLVFCFSLPAGLGLYWVASAVCRILIQLAINKKMGTQTIEDILQEQFEKINKKRQKQGLKPHILDKKFIASVRRNLENQNKSDEDSKIIEDMMKKDRKESTDYYNTGSSLRAKANMVAKYNDKNENK